MKRVPAYAFQPISDRSTDTPFFSASITYLCTNSWAKAPVSVTTIVNFATGKKL